ncbi:MAG TPA: hypothetical protein VMD59_10130 [Acidimicrobiales bacterium]|nr:hypothetical protein [Acidimicrobiales bacterium]
MLLGASTTAGLAVFAVFVALAVVLAGFVIHFAVRSARQLRGGSPGGETSAADPAQPSSGPPAEAGMPPAGRQKRGSGRARSAGGPGAARPSRSAGPAAGPGAARPSRSAGPAAGSAAGGPSRSGDPAAGPKEAGGRSSTRPPRAAAPRSRVRPPRPDGSR